MPDSEVMNHPPAYMETECYTAQEDRNFIRSLVRHEGVADVGAGDLLVTDAGGLTVNVAAGRAFIYSDSTAHGTYQVWAGSTTNLTVDDNVTNYIIARVYAVTEQGDTPAPDRWELQSVTSLPANRYLLLAEVTASGGDISGVTDKRVAAVGLASKAAVEIVYTANGSFDPANYPGFVALDVTCVGGGGGSGGVAAAASDQASSGGGGAGAVAKSIIPATAISGPVTVTVGSGTTGHSSGTAPNAFTGGSSSFGAMVIAVGGSNGGGHSGTTTNARALGGSGGAASSCTGDRRISGGDGQAGMVVGGQAIPSGTGGGNLIAPAQGVRVTNAVGAGIAPGGGGPGLMYTTGTSTGSPGGGGLVIVRVLY